MVRLDIVSINTHACSESEFEIEPEAWIQRTWSFSFLGLPSFLFEYSGMVFADSPSISGRLLESAYECIFGCVAYRYGSSDNFG
jgi:hypothetical protein